MKKSAQKELAGGYELSEQGTFLIRDYNHKKPFSNFLPGIAGFYGVPMWAFYVNRGQGIASFGTRNKDNAILEFFPANKAYQNTNRLGFRTFIKIQSASKTVFYEPFAYPESDGSVREQTLEIGAHEFAIREIHKAQGLEVCVRYFTIPGEPLAVLAREVSITNLVSHPLSLEILDGLPQVNPFGMNEFFVKQMSRTIEAWMVADNLDRKAPFLRLKVDATDRPEVTAITEGNFFFSCHESRGDTAGEMLEPIVDPAAVFGTVSDFSYPQRFLETGLFKPARQITANKTPCAFSATHFKLAPGRTKRIRSYFGHARSVELLNRYVAKARSGSYYDKKREENRRLIQGIQSRLFTVSGSAVYDQYCGQTYLDNAMRGGVPVRLGDKKDGSVFYVYSRKHGDLERDYNRFLVEPSFFSQGDGNYRDVNQNRRSDVWIDPWVKDLNVRTFLNLLQIDGFNPLVVKGAQFRLRMNTDSKKVLKKFFGGEVRLAAETFFKEPFSPGDLYQFLEEHKLASPQRFHQIFVLLKRSLVREERAEHGEGFWVDHWTYNLDLVESYLSIYPEEKKKLLFGTQEFVFYDDDHFVRPRSEKYHLKSKTVVRQYKAVGRDKDKTKLIQSRAQEPNVLRDRGGKGQPYRTILFVKLLSLFANKYASLDPKGVGIEMEADKPSWYDALNGLPGVLGSSLCETFELKRLAVFLIHAMEEAGLERSAKIELPVELAGFVDVLHQATGRYFQSAGDARDLDFWDRTVSAKESFRRDVFFGIQGKLRGVSIEDLRAFLEHAREKIDIGIERALDRKSGMYPTYFENRIERFSLGSRKTKDPDGGTVTRTEVKPSVFHSEALPLFLESAVHALKVEPDPSRRKAIVKAVRESALFDTKLGMYKVNASLVSASLEIGRACVFAPGWLENESIWLHMEYKFLIEILKGGMPEEFFKDLKRSLVPFQPAERYGRSVLENSSFIVSSAFPDATLHGTGFVARLSGSTAEFIQMWLVMNVGKRPFALGPDGKLLLRFEPTLPADFFTRQETDRRYVDMDGEEVRVRVPKNAFAFLFLGKTLVVYHNTKQLDTYGKMRVMVKRITLRFKNGETAEFRGDTVPSPYAVKVRDEFVPRIDIELG